MITGAGSGTMALDVSSSSSNGNVDRSGVNLRVLSVFHDVFEICNQGTQPVGVWLRVDTVVSGS